MLSTILLGALGAATVVPACTPLSTFPPMPDTSTVEPWVYPIPQSMTAALSYTRRKLTPGMETTFNLPPAVPEWVWNDIARALDAAPMTSDDQPAVTVEVVRVNGGKAEVDVVYPTADGFHQRVTIGLRLDPLQLPRVDFERRWRLPVAAPTSNWSRRQIPAYVQDDLGESVAPAAAEE